MARAHDSPETAPWPTHACPPQAATWFTLRRFAALLALLIFACFPDVLLGWKTFFHHDFGVFGYPFAHFLRESYWRGQIPLWDPLNHCGAPFLAQWNTLPCYPGSLVYILLPLPWSLNVYCLAHLFLAGIGMDVLAFRWTSSRWAAALAGLGFAVNGWAFSALAWPNNIAVYAWMPWVVWAVERGVESGRRRLLLAIIIGALQMLAGFPEGIAFTWTMAAANFLRMWRAAPSRARALLRFCAIGICVAGVCAAQLFPFLDLLRHSQRGPAYGDAAGAMPASGWANFLIPMFRLHPERYGVFFQAGQNWVSSYYPGILVLTLAIAALVRLRNWRTRMLGAGALLGGLLALGRHALIYPLARAFLPSIGLMNFPIKFVLLPIFCLPLLAAFVIAELETGKASEKKKMWRTIFATAIALALAMAALLIGEKIRPRLPQFWPLVARNAARGALLLGVSLAALFAAERTARVQRRQRWRLAVLSLMAIDILTHVPRQNPRASADLLKPGIAAATLSPFPELGAERVWLDPATTQELNRRIVPDADAQFLGYRLMFIDNLNLLDGVPRVGGFLSLVLERSQEVISMLNQTGLEKAAPAFDFLGVSYVPDRRKPLAWRRRAGSLPMITAGQKPVFLAGDQMLREFFSPDFSPRKTVLLEPSAKLMIGARGAARVKILRQEVSAQGVQALVQADAPSLAVIAQSYFHCWKARVDGKPVPIWRANYAFQALAVPSGKHEIKIVYDDPAFKAGAVVSLLSAASLAAAGWRWRRARPLESAAKR